MAGPYVFFGVERSETEGAKKMKFSKVFRAGHNDAFLSGAVL
jgi:hypothetical protein